MSLKITLPADLRSEVSYEGTSFKPKRGAPFEFGYKRHAYLIPNKWRSKQPPYAARLLVGFSVGHVATYDMMDLVRLVRSVRKEQLGTVDSSFVYQKGIFTHSDGTQVVEDAAQVIILNLSEDVSLTEFRRQMLELAEVIRESMQQEMVILEIQKGGRVLVTYGIDAEDWSDPNWDEEDYEETDCEEDE